jgi:signal transduction histidine kinase
LIAGTRDIDAQHMEKRLPLPVHHDEIYHLATTFNDLLSRVENNLKREKQITADVSHELRTPLAAIRGTLEVLIRKPREPEHYVQKIEQVILETVKASQMLDQLLNLARIEAGQVQPVKEPVLLYPLMINLNKQWQSALNEKQINFSIEIPEPLNVIADSNLLELIISNLISNALKYTPQHGAIQCTWDANTHSLAIHDNGTGIPTAHLPYIFNPFYRADASRNSKIPGTGLGLSIAKKLADLQQIKLSVKSKEGEGTSFFMQF